MTSEEVARFLSFISPEGLTGCWLWTGSQKGKGYGAFRLHGKMQQAHRVSYEHFVGPLGTNLACHHCNTPACVNPIHLYPGTYSENTKQAMQQGRQFIAYGELSGTSKLTWEQVRQIRKDSRAQRKIATSYGISQLHVSRIKRGLVWKERHDEGQEELEA